eukprot:scaffold250658_cov42-Tisochrysis_lutea.AAC.2
MSKSKRPSVPSASRLRRAQPEGGSALAPRARGAHAFRFPLGGGKGKGGNSEPARPPATLKSKR